MIALGALLSALVALTPAAAQETSDTADAVVDGSSFGWGETTTVTGAGFRPGTQVKVILYAGNHLLATVNADSAGGFSTSVTIPSGIASSNQYQLTVQGIGGDDLFGYIAIPVTILGPTPIVGIDDAELAWEQVATVSGERYAAGSAITVSLFPNNTPLGNGTAGSDGAFAIDIRIPRDLPSAPNYQLAITGQGIDSLFHFDTIEITIIGDRPTVHVDAVDVARGSSVGVQGQLFDPNTDATLTLLPGFEQLAVVPVEDDGTFSTSITIPAAAFGKDPHALVVTGYGKDGLFTYDTSLLRIDGPSQSPGPTVSTIVGSDPGPPRLERFVDRILGDRLPPVPTSDGGSGLWFVVLVLMALVVLLLILTSRRRPGR